jgi:achilleol B synthase
MNIRTKSLYQTIDRSVECTSSAVQTLVMFRELYPGYRSEEIGECIKGASKFIENKQRKDGSWYSK